MPLLLKELAKLKPTIEQIQAGGFDAGDIDKLIIWLRPYAGKETVLYEMANYVAHSDARDRGPARESIEYFVDAIRHFREYVSEKRPIDLSGPLPAYIYRLFISQTRLADEARLKAEHRLSRDTLIGKIRKSFTRNEKDGTYSAQAHKMGTGLLGALQFVISFIHAREAFHVRDFHKDLKDVMRAQKIDFDEAAWDGQSDRISLAVLCLVSNTEFTLPEKGRANCRLDTESHYRLLSGQRRLPDGTMSSEPTSFGRLMIRGEATVSSANEAPLRVSFPLIATDLDPHEHCDPNLFRRYRAPDDFGDCELEDIDFAPDMALSNDFKIVRADSLVG